MTENQWKLTDSGKHRQKDRQIDGQTDRQIDRQTDKKTETERQTNQVYRKGKIRTIMGIDIY